MIERDTFHDQHVSSELEAISEQEQHSDLVQAYGLYFIALLKSLKLEEEVVVSNEVTTREVTDYDSTLTLGVIGESEHSLALTVSAENPQSSQPISSILIPRTDEGWPIYKDRQDQLWTDFFYTTEEHVLKPVRTSTPIPLDGVLFQYSHLLSEGVDEQALRLHQEALIGITSDKNSVKELLITSDVAAPPGRHIKQSSSSPFSQEIEDFFAEFPSINDFVVKGTSGSQGSEVKMFSRENIKEAETFALHLMIEGQDVLLEKRILPYPVQIEAEDGTIYPADTTDYNLRVLVTTEKTPRVIDAEVRFGEFGQNPINISRGAKAVRPEKVLPQELIERAYEVSRKATAVVREKVEIHEDTIGVIGTDVIIDQSGTPYIIEVNSGCVGGFGTLCRIDKKPLSSVREKLIPSTEKFLQQSRDERLSDHELERIPFSKLDYVVLGQLYYEQGFTEKAIQQYEEMLSKYPDSKGVSSMLGVHYYHKKEYEIASNYFLDAISENPNDALSIDLLARIFVHTEEYDLAAIVYDNHFKPNLEIKNAHLLSGRAIVELHLTGDANRALQIMKEYRPDFEYDEEWKREYEFVELLTSLSTDSESNLAPISIEALAQIVNEIADEHERNKEVNCEDRTTTSK